MRTLRRRLPAVMSLLAATHCASGNLPGYGTTLVSAPIAPAWAGPVRQHFAWSAAGAVVSGARLPNLVPSTGSSIAVPRGVLETAIRFRPHRGPVEVRIPFELSLGAGSLLSGNTGVPVAEAAYAWGLGAGIWLDEYDGGAYWGGLIDLMLFYGTTRSVIPALEEGPPGAFRTSEDQVTLWLVRATLLGGWRFDRWRVFAGVTLRNVPALEDVSGDEGAAPSRARIDGGPAFLIWSVGFDVAVTDWLTLYFSVQEPLCVESLDHGYTPVLGGGFDVGIS